VILAKVLSNRKPPYGVAGGLYDALADTNGDAFTATNDQIVHWIMRVRELEGYFIDPAAASAVQALASAVKEGKVKKDEIIMLNCTGGGSIEAMEQGYVHKEPDLILDPDLSAEEVIKRVSALF
jgi:cysteate synthase